MWTETGMDLRRLIVLAYGVKPFQVDGPDWLQTDRFDITARFPQGYPKPRQGPNPALRIMLRNMLADRFKLVVHRETREMPAYGLVVAK
jgi:uncharacterized protein (TIGR03435 family)